MNNIDLNFEEYIKNFKTNFNNFNSYNNYLDIEKFIISQDDNNNFYLNNNTIFYGPDGIGKYSLVLNLLKKISPSSLKYEKKICINFNKMEYFIKISDIHYEVDMSILGCNSKLFWNEIFNHFIDSILNKSDKKGIILCKNFNEINLELLEIFYSYLGRQINNNLTIKFFIISNSISFIPDSIINSCKIIKLSKPSKSKYNEILKNNNFKVENINKINNIKDYQNLLEEKKKLKCNSIKIENYIDTTDFVKVQNITNQIIEIIIDKYINYKLLRNILYELLIYEIDIEQFLFYILNILFQKKYNFTQHKYNLIILKIINFIKLYNNNYRPIYHLESIIIYIKELYHNDSELSENS